MTRKSRRACITVGLAVVAVSATAQMEETAGRAQAPPPSSGFVIRGSSVATGTPPPGVAPPDGASTSPLQVLRQVPRVQFEGRDKIKSANTPFPVSTPIGPAPEIVPTRADAAETPGISRKSPEPTKKPGKIRGFLGSIPVIGPKVAGRTPQPEEIENAVPTPGPAEGVPESAQPGMDSARTVPPPPTLYPPPPDRDGGAPPANSGVSRPVVSTAENPAGSGYRPITGNNSMVPAEATGDDVTSGSQVPATVTQPRPGVVLGGTAHRPSVEGDFAITPKDFQVNREPHPTPGGIMIGPGHTPVAAATPPPPPAEAAAPAVPVVMRAARNTSPTLEPNDLAMPNPAVEDNEALRDSYTAAVYLARAGNYELASDQFREFASRHPSSRLAPRALFLAAIVEPDPAKAADARERLKINYADSDYVKELAVRLPGEDTSTSSTALKNTTARLETEVASA
ncbi:MAG: hypothetical protein K1X53_15890, partial [Candidatus Sumerlaeaceae bacterium]|nr:hypothetical protein [Candidatus Sumerlaeaceae bacterium]